MQKSALGTLKIALLEFLLYYGMHSTSTAMCKIMFPGAYPNFCLRFSPKNMETSRSSNSYTPSGVITQARNSDKMLHRNDLSPKCLV